MKKLNGKKIDEIVISEVNDDKKWDEWETVNSKKTLTLEVSDQMVNLLKIVAKLKGEKDIQSLIKSWIEERLLFEEKIINNALEVKKVLK